MKIGFDIGGVLSKYPEQFKKLICSLLGVKDSTPFAEQLSNTKNDIYIITDQYPKDKVLKSLIENGFYSTYASSGLKLQTKNEYWDKFCRGIIHPNNIYCADYEKYGNMAKAILIKELGIDIFIDDFEPYLAWDSSLGPQLILLKIMPDVYKPYWNNNWKCEGGDFGRRKYANP